MTTQTDDLVTRDRACWFELNLDLTSDVRRDRPDRIFSSDDPMWDKLANEKRLNRGCLCVGSYMRVGTDFIPNRVKTESSIVMGWEAAREKMRRFEAENRISDTPLSDEIREHNEKTEQARNAPTATAEAFVKALEPLVNAVASTKESKR